MKSKIKKPDLCGRYLLAEVPSISSPIFPKGTQIIVGINALNGNYNSFVMPLINGTTILDCVPDRKKFLREKRKEIAVQLSNGSTEPIVFICRQVEYDDAESILFVYDKQTHYNGVTDIGDNLRLSSMSLSQLYAFLHDYIEVFASSVEDTQTLEKNDGKWPVGEFVVEETQVKIPFAPFEIVEESSTIGKDITEIEMVEVAEKRI